MLLILLAEEVQAGQQSSANRGELDESAQDREERVVHHRVLFRPVRD